MKLRVFAALCAFASVASAQLQLPVGTSVLATYNSAAFGIASAPVAIEFSADGSTILIGVNGNLPNSAIFSAPVLRDPVSQRVVGFGTSSFFAPAPYLDAGLEIGPNGHLFYSEFPTTNLGQFVNGTLYQHPFIGIAGTLGGLTFVPAGMPNAGTMLVSSFSGNEIYAISTVVGQNGDLVPTGATLFATMPVNHLEGMRFIPSGPFAGDLLVCDFNDPGTLWRVDIDPSTGQPVGGAVNSSAVPFIGNFDLQDGIAFDPITSDLFITDWQSFLVTQITGLSTLDSLVPNRTTLSVAGQSLAFHWRCGTANASKYYLLVMGISGSSPGVPVGSINVAINPDFVTNVAYQLRYELPFISFENFLSVSGEGTSVFYLAPGVIAQEAAGLELTFAGLMIDTLDFATNATTITLVP